MDAKIFYETLHDLSECCKHHDLNPLEICLASFYATISPEEEVPEIIMSELVSRIQSSKNSSDHEILNLMESFFETIREILSFETEDLDPYPLLLSDWTANLNLKTFHSQERLISILDAFLLQVKKEELDLSELTREIGNKNFQDAKLTLKIFLKQTRFQLNNSSDLCKFFEHILLACFLIRKELYAKL